MHEWMAENPMRAVDWRWQRAVGYLNSQQAKPSYKRDGASSCRWIRKAINFRKAWLEATSEAAKFATVQRFSSLYWAYWLYSEPTATMRWAIEAYLLARCSDEDIAGRIGTSPAVVAAYEALFFNVREKLGQQEYILGVVLRNAVQRGISVREYDLLLKLYGFFYGPTVVSTFNSKTVNPIWCNTPDGVAAAIQDDTINTLKLQSAIGAKTLIVNSHTQLPLLDLFTKFVEIERTTNTAERAQGQVMEHLAAMFSAIPLSVAGRDPRQNHRVIGPTARSSFDKSAVELTYSEVMQVSVGQHIPDAEAVLNLTFPQAALPAPSAGGNDA